MEHIKNIIFDLGGVLLNIDYNKTSLEFKKLGIGNFDELFSQFTADALFENLETGKVSESDFYSNIGKYCISGTTQTQLETAWNAMLLRFRIESLKKIEELGKKYRLFLLSNTNSIHLSAFKKIFTEDTGVGSLDSYFEKSYYSHLIQMRKPYTATYDFVLQDAGIKADETLFIDDSFNNIEAAKTVGIKTHLLLSDEKIEDIFSTYSL